MKKLNNEQRKLAEENFGLIDEFFRKNPSFDREEYWGIAALSLCEACTGKYIEEISFREYVFRWMRTRIINEIKSSRYQKRNGGEILSLDEEIFSDKDSKRKESFDKPIISKFDNDPYFGFIVKDVLNEAGMTRIEKIVFLSETNMADYTDSVPALKSRNYPKYRDEMRKKLKNYYFSYEKTA